MADADVRAAALAETLDGANAELAVKLAALQVCLTVLLKRYKDSG